MAKKIQKKNNAVGDLPIARILPNMITLLSLCSGLTAMRFAFQDKWEAAVIAIVIAAILDTLDGRVARMFNMASKFGAELDSLSDAICFGVAPAFLLYHWSLSDASSPFGWIAVLVFVVCAVVRLARFNTMIDKPGAPWQKAFFTGVPAPGGAMLAMLPIVSVLAFGIHKYISPTMVAIWLICIGALMVSRVPTLALKGWHISVVWVRPMMVAFGALIAALVTHTWGVLFALDILYLCSLPLGWILYNRRMKS